MWWFIFFALVMGGLMGAARSSPRQPQDYPENEYDYDCGGGCDDSCE